jgi:hypothetical protein
MTIEIHKPELEALILDRMKSGAFQDVEDVLLQALRSPSQGDQAAPRKQKKNLAQFLLESPLRGSGLRLERLKDYPRPLDL